MEKTWKILLLLSLVLSLASITGVASIYKKINGNRAVSSVPAAKTGDVPKSGAGESSQTSSNLESKTAYGFVGYPVSDKLAENGGVKSFSLKGHWTFDKEPKFDYANKTEEDQLIAVEISGETQVEFLGLKKQENKTVSGQDLKITDLNSPYLVVFKDAVMSGTAKIFAKEIKIYPPVTK